jgi:NAD-dependent dihydropyrimidine dehydrogenase PreA subunit
MTILLYKYLHLGVKEFFAEGSITIDKRTCKGIECNLCIEACSANALHWEAGEVGIFITQELCIYCGACVLSCVVDDCIKIWRKRFTGEVERFSKPRDVVVLQHNIKTKKRLDRVCKHQKISRALRRERALVSCANWNQKKEEGIG